MLSFRYHSDPEKRLTGDSAFVCELIPELHTEYNKSLVVLSPQTADSEYCLQSKQLNAVHLKVNGIESLSLTEIHDLNEREFLRFGKKFGDIAFEYILKNSKTGDICILNDFIENGSILKLKSKGIKIIQIAHVLPSEYIFREYLEDPCESEKIHLQNRFSVLMLWTISFFQKFVRRHDQLVNILGSLFRSKLYKLLPMEAWIGFYQERESILNSNFIVVPTTAMKIKILKAYNVQENKIQVISWGTALPPKMADVLDEIESVQHQGFFAENNFTILTMSRISPEKGLEHLLDSLDWIEQNYKSIAEKVQVIICGRPGMIRGHEYLELLKEKSSKLKYIKVQFPGHVTGNKKSAYFYLSDLYILPSKYESFGLSLLEAMRHGLPVLASNTDGARDLVTEEFGNLFNIENKESRVSQLGQLIVDYFKKDLSSPKKMAFEKSMTYTWNNVSSSIIELTKR